jgi:small subunit ribosomal protein S27Ae
MKHKPTKVSELIKKNKICPRCGDATYMAEHKDRWYCGKCHLTSFKS